MDRRSVVLLTLYALAALAPIVIAILFGACPRGL